MYGRILPIVLILGLLVSCGEEPKPVPPPVRKPLVILVGTDLSTFDPQILFEVDSSYVLGNIFDALVEFDSSFRLSPSLAKRWTNPDDQTWRFYLNEKARFSDGAPLKASDIRFSIERLKSLPNSDLRGFTEHISRIHVINDQTIDIKTDTPFSILNDLVFIPILSERHVLKMGDRIRERPLGTGAYQLAIHEPGKKIVLKRNPYYSPAPEVEQIDFVISTGRDRNLEEVLEMKPDLSVTLPFRKIEEFQKLNPPDLQILRSNGISVEYLMFNLRPSIPGFTKNPLLDVRLRKALAHAINKTEMIDAIFKGFGRPATQLIAPEIFGYDSTIRPPEYNVEEARRLIAEAGFQNIELPIYTFEGGTYRLEKLLIEHLNRAGIKSSIKTWKEISDMNSALNSGDFVITMGGYVPTSGDAAELLSFGLHTRTEGKSFGKGNYADYSNPEVDHFSEQNLRELDTRTRLDMLQQAMRIVNNDLPYLPLLIYDDVYVISKRIHWIPPASGEIKVRNISYR